MMGKKKYGVILSLCLYLSISSANLSYAQELKSDATFSVSSSGEESEIGSLVLKQVPSFSYGTIDEKVLLNGFENLHAKNQDSIIIRDTRIGSADWTLQASMNQLTNSETNVNLENMTLTLSGSGSLGGKLQGTIPDTTESITLAKSSGAHGTHEFKIYEDKATLSVGPNPNLKLEDTTTFDAVINWNLTPDQPKVPSA